MTFEIKICGITTPAALRSAAEAGATAIGLVFADSVRRVDVQTAARLAGAAPLGLTRVAVFRHPVSELVRRVLGEVRIDRVQSDADDLESIRSVLGATPFMPVYRDGPDLAALVDARAARAQTPGRILIEGPRSGSGLTPDWTRIAAIRSVPVVLAGGLTPDNVAAAIRAVRPVGVDVSSGVESAPGVKDPTRIHAFVHAARAAFAQQNQPHGSHP
ncbi:MAG: phosphoribosylanthranilate isomerase [Phycisphaerales bacterium]